MVGHKFRVNKRFLFNVKYDGHISTRKFNEGDIITVLDIIKPNGIKMILLDKDIGWVSLNNLIWRKLDLI